MDQLLVLDTVGSSGGEAITDFVDDLKARYSSLWALREGCQGLSDGASYYSMVFEARPAGKVVASFYAFPPGVTVDATARIGATMQGAAVRIAADPPFWGVPDGTDDPHIGASPFRNSASVNLSCR